uniref:Acyclic terpene utilisation N-terminal domain-containing protein n=1 Tax=Aegilops tauschii subsp. strangulata TaxID=200361 RepID=A0A453S5D1_AEGTS
MEAVPLEEVQNCVVKLRSNPQRRKNQVYVGCGAGFGGDRPMAALKLLERVEELNYIVLECLAERTLADRYQVMLSGGKGFDPRVKEWLSMLLPLALDREVCIITNMGASKTMLTVALLYLICFVFPIRYCKSLSHLLVDPPGAQKEILDLASSLGLEITVAVAYESSISGPENSVLWNESMGVAEGRSTYLGAAPIVHCLENYKPHVVITSRVADAALFLAPMVYELGWNWNDFEKLAQGTLASHLLECGCQLTGGYFMHPGDAYRDFSFEQLRDLSLPYAEVSYKGEVCVGKAKGSGGLLSYSTCAEQLLYEVGDPANYITPDLVRSSYISSPL